MTILLKDGVTYLQWKPSSEEKFEEIVKEHYKGLFGPDALYFDIKHKIVSSAGRGSIPDGYAISFANKKLYLVEYELSQHDAYEHIASQAVKFASGMENPKTLDQLIDTIYNQIKEDPVTHAWAVTKVGGEVYKYITEAISGQPTLIIIIDEISESLKESTKNLPLRPILVEFKTYQHEKAELVHIHLFEPIQPRKTVVEPPVTPNGEKNKTIAGFRFRDKHYEVSSWKDLLLEFSRVMSDLQGNNFEKVLALRGRKRPWFTRNPDELRAPERVGNTGIYVETNMSANFIVKTCQKMLVNFGYPTSDLSIEIT